MQPAFCVFLIRKFDLVSSVFVSFSVSLVGGSCYLLYILPGFTVLCVLFVCSSLAPLCILLEELGPSLSRKLCKSVPPTTCVEK